ncbi:hypothetical protein PVAP13_2NG242000 [Panicum virgatum]|uniref:Uncharacterized protein n=1 Tax=Panicum virgatum TaxID=38727 RepID=A0A8T0VFW6_PANVG|nr:hypothetical protein PVAP13_2NG242000 [Panicum virgatum]KAG2633668.1 hypothetical protein PVAP13_2NG242000 [Panicum virgatum]
MPRYGLILTCTLDVLQNVYERWEIIFPLICLISFNLETVDIFYSWTVRLPMHDKKKEVKEMPEPRSRGASNSNSRGTRSGADRAGRNSSIQSGSSGTDYMASRSSILGPAVAASNSTRKQTVPSLSANKDGVPNGSVEPAQSSSGFQHTWCGVPGLLARWQQQTYHMWSNPIFV